MPQTRYRAQPQRAQVEVAPRNLTMCHRVSYATYQWGEPISLLNRQRIVGDRRFPLAFERLQWKRPAVRGSNHSLVQAVPWNACVGSGSDLTFNSTDGF